MWFLFLWLYGHITVTNSSFLKWQYTLCIYPSEIRTPAANFVRNVFPFPGEGGLEERKGRERKKEKETVFENEFAHRLQFFCSLDGLKKKKKKVKKK